ncbi:MAG: CHAD domain-containing protein [Anaerolineales bacterium]|nr:CHAD domain-containing protein [Anaerolineales bacterium]
MEDEIIFDPENSQEGLPSVPAPQDPLNPGPVSTDLLVDGDIQPASLEHVRELALVLFDHTRPLHALGEDSRHLVDLAALLKETSIGGTRKKALRSIRELVQEHVAEEISLDRQNLLGAVIAYYQGIIKRSDFERLDLSPQQQREALTIVALLRIATGLNDSGSEQTVIKQVELGRREMWIVVEGREVVNDAAAAEHQARLWAKIGYPEVKVLEPAEAASRFLPFPPPVESMGIEPGDPLAEAGRKVMRFQFAQVLRWEEGTRLGEDAEALHDMRVATRRLRAAFEVFEDAFENRALKPYLNGLRATGRALGAVRDLDVLMEKANIYLGTLPEKHRSGLNPLLQAWELQRDAARDQMLAFLDSQDYHIFKRKFNIFVQTPGAGARSLPKDQPTPYLVSQLAPILIYSRLAVVRSYDPYLVDAPIERLHALRIEFKKLRYTVEYFREVLGAESTSVINDLKGIQDHLGDLNDADVATQLLRQFVDSWEAQQLSLPISERQNPAVIMNYLAYRYAERHRLVATFSEAWAYINRPEFRKNLARSISVL